MTTARAALGLLLGAFALTSCDTARDSALEPVGPAFTNVGVGNDGPSVNGGGGSMVNNPFGGPPRRLSASIQARTRDGVTTGTIQFRNRALDPFVDLQLRGEIDCMTIVGNTAALGGVITQMLSFPPFFGDRTGRRFWIQVQDNGEGEAALLDRFSIFHSHIGIVGCAINQFALGYTNLQDGDVQVKP